MKNLKVLFTLIALGLGFTGFSQEVIIVNKTSCDFTYNLSEGYINTGCTPSGPSTNGTVASSSQVKILPTTADEFIHVILSPNTCNTSLELTPYMSANCSLCTVYPALNTKGTVYCDACGGLVDIHWEVNCQGASVITIE